MARQSGYRRYLASAGSWLVLLWSLIGAYLFWCGPTLLLRQVTGPLELCAGIWLALTLFVLAYVVWLAETHRSDASHSPEHLENHKNRRVILLGLLGGFAIALPALVITTLAFITAFPHFFQAIRTKGVTVELVPPERGIVNNRPKPNAYILAVDLSGSTVQGREDPQLELVEMAVDDLFSKESGGVLADLVQHQDDFGLYVFAGSRRLVIHPGMENNLRSTDMPAEFRRAVKDNMGKLEADETDIITLLNHVAGRLYSKSHEYEHVTVILFSDFFQDVEGDSDGRLRKEVAGTVKRISDLENVHLLGMVMKSSSESGVNIRPWLEKYTERDVWRVLSLEEYGDKKLSAERQALLIFSIYREELEKATLYLKYLPFSRDLVPDSFLKFPNESDYNVLQFGLRADKDGALTKVSIRFELQPDNPVTLDFGDGKPPFELVDNHQETVPVSLKSRLDVSRSAECDLLVAVPSQAVVHVVRVVILPVIGDFPFRILQWSGGLLGSMLILLAGCLLDLAPWKAQLKARVRRMTDPEVPLWPSASAVQSQAQVGKPPAQEEP